MNDSRILKKPEIIVFAGPNGSGKSTITRLLKPSQIEYINADEIKRILNCSDLDAAKFAENRREKCLLEKKDFCFETVLSTDRNLNLLNRAKENGFFIRCYYVLTVDPMINVGRIKSRVASGGHDVPFDKIISRYSKALSLVPQLISVCDVVHIYDNSLDNMFRIFKKRKTDFFYDELENIWQKEDIIALTKIDSCVKTDLN